MKTKIQEHIDSSKTVYYTYANGAPATPEQWQRQQFGETGAECVRRLREEYRKEHASRTGNAT